MAPSGHRDAATINSQGASASTSSSISGATTTTATAATSALPYNNSWKLPNLRAECKNLGLASSSSMNKSELLAILNLRSYTT